nr:MAG TPA: Major capsid protein [Caudoviricetes sp.]
MENQINNTSVEEVQEQTETTEVKAKEEVKTFTQEEVDKIIAKRIAREKKDIEAKIEAERKQAEELAKLSEQEKASKLLEIKEKELEEKIRAFESEKLLNETSKQLASKNLPTEFAEILKGVDAETTLENIKVFEEKFNAALEVKVNERLRGNVPKVATKVAGTITKEDFAKMSYADRVKLFNENRELYNQLNK